jgi:cytidine deaminase
MTRLALTDQDQQLISEARQLIRLRQREDWHAVSAVLRTRTGQIFRGLHLEAYVGRIAVCAEAGAIGAAALTGDTDVETIVSVYKTGQIVSPCGMCRELISDYSPMATVILEDELGAFKTPVMELIPLKYTRNEQTKPNYAG